MKETEYQDQHNIHNINNSFGDTPLHIAVQNGDLVTVNQLFLDPGVNVNASNKYGTCPLHLAAEKGSLQIVRALLCHQDLNVNKKNAFGKTALDIASQSGHEEVVELLRELGGIGSNRTRK
ncbi:ankyrin repeat domain-containing protein [Candidatus Cardinium hertigii]|uniref:ankyrin repeat domain-containing protein n=1 Tax=Candidatus Cardinium hertigii TaxID=247481 RepID=UPI003D7E50AC